MFFYNNKSTSFGRDFFFFLVDLFISYVLKEEAHTILKNKNSRHIHRKSGKVWFVSRRSPFRTDAGWVGKAGWPRKPVRALQAWRLERNR